MLDAAVLAVYVAQAAFLYAPQSQQVYFRLRERGGHNDGFSRCQPGYDE